MDNNSLIFINDDLSYTTHSAESAHSLELNKWKDWYCSAGVRSIYIDFDGNIFRGTCGVGGWYGNIFNVTGSVNTNELTNEKWIKCNKDVCSCGADMAVPKVRDLSKVWPTNTIDPYFKQNSTTTGQLWIDLKDTGNLSNPTAVFSKTIDMFKSVIWDIGRRCNFDCWYCSKNSHNNYEVHKNLGMFSAAYENLKKFWNDDNERIKFVFTGGEPSVYKDYLPFVKLLKSDNHIIHTTSNGSNTEKYYAELAEVSDIVFSIHLPYVKQFGLDRFLKVVSAAAETTERGFKENTASKYNWVIVRIMLDPGNLEVAKETYHEFQKYSKYMNFVLAVDLIHQVENGHALHPYTVDELNWISLING